MHVTQSALGAASMPDLLGREPAVFVAAFPVPLTDVFAGALMGLAALAFFCAAHRFRCASAIFFRATGESVLFLAVPVFCALLVADFALLDDPGGLPRRFRAWPGERRLRACCNRVISESIVERRAARFMFKIYQERAYFNDLVLNVR